jgi:hypothetical protein
MTLAQRCALQALRPRGRVVDAKIVRGTEQSSETGRIRTPARFVLVRLQTWGALERRGWIEQRPPRSRCFVITAAGRVALAEAR